MNAQRFVQCICLLVVCLFVAWGVTDFMNGVPNRRVEASANLGEIFYVGGGGSGNYTRIQDAVDNASSGDTIYVYTGTYNENVIVDTTVTLIGENQGSTIIDGGGGGDTVVITADDVRINFFTVQHAGDVETGAGINVISSNVTVANCTSISNYRYGIVLKNCSHATLLNCTSSGNQFAGIALYNTSESDIRGCLVLDHQGISLSLPGGRFSKNDGEEPSRFIHVISSNVSYEDTLIPAISTNVTVRDDVTGVQHSDLTEFDGSYTITFSNFPNTEYNNGDHLTIWANATGVFSGWKGISETNINTSQVPQYIEDIKLQWVGGSGIILVNSDNNSFRRCTGSNNSGGMVIKTSHGNSLFRCIGSNNTQGFAIFSSNNTTMFNCTLNGNQYGLVIAFNGSHNNVTSTKIYGNDFGIMVNQSNQNLVYNNYFDNTVNAVDDGINLWNISKTLGTNIINHSYLGGNAWVDYPGGDANGDGLGDTFLPFNSLGGILHGGDYHPLTVPNNAPVALDDNVTVQEDSSNNVIDALANDSDPDNQTLSILSIVQPLHGTATNNNTYITYTPTPDYYGTDSINYTITDGNTTDTATIHITVIGVNEPPVASDDYATVWEDSQNNSIDALANDTDPENDSLSITDLVQPLHGTATNNNTYITYTPTPDYYGTDSINYTITDGNTTDTATIHITITGINDPPNAQHDYVTVYEDSFNNIIDALANDTDPENDNLSIVSIIPPSYGTAINNHTHITYTPNPNYAGGDPIIYTIYDGELTDIGTVDVYVIEVNDPPNANFTYTPPDPIVEDIIYFTDTSGDIDVTGSITQWLWEFGDGTTTDVQNPIKGYENTGIYWVNLTVWDDQGANDTISRNITVNLPTLDYMTISHGAGNEILDDTISTDLFVTLYASGYNNTYGYIGLINTSWGIINSASNASLNTSQGVSVTYYSGWLDGTSTIEVTSSGATDTVIFTINSQLFSMVLYRGWNLITIPLSHTWTAETLGENLTACTVISKFNADTQGFSTHIVGVPWDDFPIEDGAGYFAYVSTDSIFTMTGSPIITVSINISQAWNIIGWFDLNHTTAESLGENITGCSVMSAFQGDTQTFITHVVGIPWDDFIVRRGMGIFIYTSNDSLWTGAG